MAAIQHLRVASSNDLDQILRVPKLKTVTLELPSIEASRASLLQLEINKLLRTCGCDEAAAAFLAGLVVALGAVYWFWPIINSDPILAILIGLGYSALSIAAGKSIGKLRGRRRLATLLRAVQVDLMKSARHEDADEDHGTGRHA
jgi:hypothetical protein